MTDKLSQLWRKLLFHLRRDRFDRELEEEMRFHLEMKAQENAEAGMQPEEARYAAQRQFGNQTLLREVSREMWGFRILETLAQDIRHALRMMVKNPGFTAAAALTLALGIGATTAIFTLIQQVMLRSLPVAQPDQLWRIGDSDQCCYSTGYTQGDWNFFSWEAYKLFRANTPDFQDLAAFQIGAGNAQLGVRRAGSPVPAEARNGEYVSGNFFRTFGVSAWRGRLFIDADDQEGAQPVAVMSFHIWREKYGSDPSVVGATYQINGHPFTMIGVAPPGFFGAKVDIGRMPDFWLPLTTEPLIAGATTRLKDSRVAWLDLIGRVRPGVSPKTLEARLQVELRQWLASHVADKSPQEKRLWEKQTLRLTPGGAGVSLMREDYKDGLRLLMVAAVCVLLIACANIANLLLARGLKDRPQTAIRAVLGASRARLARKALAESLTLSAFGAIAGIAVAYAGARLILHLAFEPDIWLPVDATPSIPALLFALGISVITGVAFGMAPAWMASQAQPIEAMRGASRSVGGNRQWAKKTLVIAQAAISLVLLSAAAMLGQSARNLERQDFGFDTGGRYLVQINPKLSNYKQEQLVPLFRAIEERLRAISGVRMVSYALLDPLSAGWIHDIRREGKPEPGQEDDFSSEWTRVMPGFFETLGGKIVMGRTITDDDNANTRPVAVINEAFAKRFFGKENPIGQRFGPAPRKNASMYEIIGVASDMGYSHPVSPRYFLPETQTTHFDEAALESREIWSHYLYTIVILAPGNHPNMQAQVKSALADVDPDLLMYAVRPYSEIIHNYFAQQNMIASLTWLFGAVGLALAATGLYGVTAYDVEQRTSEIGVRMALGAKRNDVLKLLVKQGMAPALIGMAVGGIVSFASTRLMKTLLFGVSATDPLTFIVIALLLTFVALLACWIPARRATKVDPITALRSN
jgi:putative ABC transport system permease protein